jgi:CubicO group peptidase (beta-lactamase class C family)
LKEGQTPEPLKLDSTFHLVSATKLITSIAALQCVERGQFSLDGDVTQLLPELKDPDVLTGFDDAGKAVLGKARKIITLRYFDILKRVNPETGLTWIA